MRFLGILCTLFAFLHPSLCSPSNSKREDPLPVPAFSFDDNFFHIRLDKATSDQIKEVLSNPNICPPRARRALPGRSSLQQRDNVLIQCIETTTEVLAKAKPVAQDVIELVRGYVLPSDIKVRESYPANDEENQRAALLPAMAAGASILQQSIDILPEEIPWTTALLFNVAVQQIWNHPISFQAFEIKRRGVMGDTCPAKEENACGNPLCRGGADASETCDSSSFLHNCQCTLGDCPKPNEMQMFCAQCGGADPLTGRCIGVEDKHKGCYCVADLPLEPYDVTDDEYAELQQIFDAPLWTPPVTPLPPQESLACTKLSIQDIHAHPETWKFVDQEMLDRHVGEFCEELNHLDNAAAGSFQRYYEQDTLNEMSLRAEWDSGASMTNADCNKYMLSPSKNCDWSGAPIDDNPNQYNWKWGGVQTFGKIKLSIVPIKQRARTTDLPTDKDWRNHHWWDVRIQNPEDDKHKIPKGMNGKPWDYVTLHQCLHDLRRRDWNGGAPYNCAGLVNFSGSGQISYHSWTDCFDNTWEIVSREILNEGAISVYGNHKGGCCTRCWMGIDEYKVPAKA